MVNFNIIPCFVPRNRNARSSLIYDLIRKGSIDYLLEITKNKTKVNFYLPFVNCKSATERREEDFCKLQPRGERREGDFSCRGGEARAESRDSRPRGKESHESVFADEGRRVGV